METPYEIIDQFCEQMAEIRDIIYDADMRRSTLSPEALIRIVCITTDTVVLMVRYGKAIRSEEAPRGLEPGGCTQSDGMIRG